MNLAVSVARVLLFRSLDDGTHPVVSLLVYFDAVSSSNQGGTFDWKVDTSPDSQAAFAQLATLPYFRPSLPS